MKKKKKTGVGMLYYAVSMCLIFSKSRWDASFGSSKANVNISFLKMCSNIIKYIDVYISHPFLHVSRYTSIFIVLYAHC